MRPHTKKTLILLLTLLIYVPGCVAQTEKQELQQLRDDYKNLQQVKTEFDQSLKNGKLLKTEVADFKSWIEQQQRLLVESCQAFARNSSAYPKDPPCEKILSTVSRPANINLSEEVTEGEITTQMIKQLDGSLGEFDERLLTEQSRVKSKAPRTVPVGGGSSGTGQEAVESSVGESNKEEPGDKKTGKSQKTTSGETGTPTHSTSSKKSTAPKDIPDGRNDDVVARQLREAAEKEGDPELRKKLWDEYRRYKSDSLK